VERPTTRYARSGDVSIAYQSIGSGPQTLLICPGFVSNIEIMWAEPIFHHLVSRLSRVSRVLLFDKRGTGLSDPVAMSPTLEERTDDIRAVLADAGVERVALLGVSEGGPMAMLFAASHPERVTHLMLYGTFAAGPGVGRAEGDPRAIAWYEYLVPRFEDAVDHWGEGRTIELFGAKVAHRPLERRMWGAWERSGSSPGVVRHLIAGVYSTDVRAVLPTISAPTVVLRFRDDTIVPAWCAEEVAVAITGARLVVLPGGDHVPFTIADIDRWADELEAHVTGVRPAATPDRQLLTVVFTDIVASTERAVQLGDGEWGALVGRHDVVVRSVLAEHRGREIKTLGDGFLATFDGPGRAISFARAMGDQVRELGLEVRVGVHTGECEVTADDVRGLAVNIAARVCAIADTGEVLVTSTVRDLVMGSGVQLVDRGAHTLKGVPGEWGLAAVSDHTEPAGDVLPTRTPTPRRSDRALERVALRYPALTRATVRAARSLSSR
jgi:class 3 adenylate cyclase/pimeloyl-ACP methyl ester carboxylesterase